MNRCRTCGRPSGTAEDSRRHGQEYGDGECPTQRGTGACWCADLCWSDGCTDAPDVGELMQRRADAEAAVAAEREGRLRAEADAAAMRETARELRERYAGEVDDAWCRAAWGAFDDALSGDAGRALLDRLQAAEADAAALRMRVEDIAGDFCPSHDRDTPQALDQMREALGEAVADFDDKTSGRALLAEMQALRAEAAALREQLDAIEEQRRIANATEGVTRPHDAWSTPSDRRPPTTAEWVRLLRERWQIEADCRRAADEKAAALRERVAVLRATIARLDAWTHEYGRDLCPFRADTYGEGVREAKAQVAAILRRALTMEADHD